MDLQKKRLIELLSGYSIDTPADVEYVADRLLANGVIAPPCQVGDTLYKLCTVNSRIKMGDKWDGKVVKHNCDRCGYRDCACYDIGLQKHEHELMIDVVVPKKVYSLAFLMEIMPYIGRIWFTSEEEAQKALQEHENPMTKPATGESNVNTSTDRMRIWVDDIRPAP